MIKCRVCGLENPGGIDIFCGKCSPSDWIYEPDVTESENPKLYLEKERENEGA